MKNFKVNFRAFVRAAAGFLSRAFEVYTREDFFRCTPKDTNMMTTDAEHYMELLFDEEEENGVRYLVPCAEWVQYMENLQVGAARAREA